MFAGSMGTFHAVWARVVYRLTARYRGGHRVHSPYLFHFLNFVLFEERPYYIYGKMKAVCRRLSRSRECIKGVHGGTVRVARLVQADSEALRLNELLHRICVYIHARSVVEVGTGAGVCAAYMAAADSRSTVRTLESDRALADYAVKLHKELKLNNITVYSGCMNQQLEQMLAEAGSVDMFHIVLNGNMTFDMMTAVYEACRGSAHRGSVMVIDGIHVSRQAELLWKRVVADSAVSLCVDIYRRGIVWFNPDLPHRCYTVAY